MSRQRWAQQRYLGREQMIVDLIEVTDQDPGKVFAQEVIDHHHAAMRIEDETDSGWGSRASR